MIKSCSECGKKFKLKSAIKRRLLQKYLFCGQPCARKHISQRLSGKNATNWKGGRIVRKNGYITVLKPEHPNASKQGYVKEHRLVIEEKIGRYLELREHIHHINGNKHDNRPENLQLMTLEEHLSHHNKGKKITEEHKQKLRNYWAKWREEKNK